MTATIRAEIARKGTTQTELASTIGMHRSKLSRRMTSGGWRVDELRDIAAALGVPVSTLLGAD